MFKLSDKLVSSIEINGKTYGVDMSFDNILRLTEMLNDLELSDEMHILLGIEMLFDDPLEMPIQEEVLAFKGAPYDLEQDAEYIYASFLQDYGIDLFEQQGKLHWYQFKALLAGLSETTKFKRVLEIRQMPLPTGKNSGKHRAEVEKIKKAYALKNKAVSE